MVEFAYNYRYSSLSKKMDYSLPRYRSRIDIWVIAIITLLFALVLTGLLFVRVYFSTVIRETGYRITELTKEKIKLLEERDRLNAEMAFLKSSHNLRKMTSKGTKFVAPNPNQIIRVNE